MDNSKDKNKGEEKMSIPQQKTKSNTQLLWEIAEKNTKRNKDGHTVSSKDCPYRKETGWEKSINRIE
ncbi:MAG: hypothetical protein JM58_18105 [Peptococcaceae bacterium BICA1-8]|nr:MAG: hypothetical protein JM58_18105 [Peptococcaceae bacterium BICA1-8]